MWTTDCTYVVDVEQLGLSGEDWLKVLERFHKLRPNTFEGTMVLHPLRGRSMYTNIVRAMRV